MAERQPLQPKEQPPSRLRSGADLPGKRAQDTFREPPPIRNHLDSGDGSGDEPDREFTIEAPEGSDDGSGTTIYVNAADGTATVERGGATIIDFAGGRQLRSKPHAGPGKFNDNMALRDDIDLASIASRLLEGIRADQEARREWEEAGNRGAELLGVKWEEASAEVSAEGFIARCHHPLLLGAMIKSWAMTRAELLPASGPVKVRDDLPAKTKPPIEPGSMMGPQPPLSQGPQAPGVGPAQKPKRSETADALELDMNHYLTFVDKEYYPDTSRLIMMRSLKGSQFKKIYWDPLLRRPVSRWVQGTNLIISNDCSHLSGAGRVTEYSRMRQATVRRLQRIGWWRDVLLVEPSPEATSVEMSIGASEGINPVPQLPADYPHHIYECYCELDDGPLGRDETGYTTGFPLPYCVTIDKESQTVLAIRRNWKEGDQHYQAKCRYVHFGMIPGLGFYHWGFFHILGSPQRATTAMLRLGIDSEMFASFPGGVIRKSPGSRTQTTVIRPAPGQYVPIDTGGEPIDAFVKEWPYKGMSAGLMPMMQHIEELGKELAGNVELPVGEGRVGDVPVGTIMAYVDSITRVPSAIHKDDHMAQAEEFALLKECFEDDPESLVPKDEDDRQWTCDMLRDQKLVPASDPNTPSSVHRIMQGTALVQLGGLPQFNNVANNRAIFKRALGILGIEDADELTLPPPPPGAPPPDPMAQAQQAKADAMKEANQVKMAGLQQKQQDVQRQAASDAVEAEQREKDRASQTNLESMRLQAEQMRDAREHDRETQDMGLTHQREAADSAAGHQTDMLGHAIDLTKHREQLAQQDRHHSAEQQTARQGGMLQAAANVHSTETQAETQRHATETGAAVKAHATETGAKTAKETAAAKAKPKTKPKGKGK
jgi:hypothetical protein